MSTLKRHRFAAAAWALTIWAAACGKESSNDACTRGNEGCVCYPNRTCNSGLECLSSLCVSREGTGGGSVAQAGSDDSGAGGSGAATSSAGAPSSEGGADRGGTGGRGSGGAATSGGASAGGADGGAAQETGGALSAGTGSGGKAAGGASSGGAGGASSGGTGGSVAQGGSSGKGGAGGSTAGASGGAGGKGGTGGTAQGGTAQAGSSGAGGACASGGAASLFFDNFECGTAAWTPQVAGSFALVMDGSNTYQRGTLTNSLALSSAGSAAWGNVRIEVRVKALSFGSATDTSYVALYGHFLDASNYHAIAWQGNGTVALRERTNGGGGDSYNQDTILTLNTWYTLAIEFSGTTTRILVDGALISTSIGSTAITGRMALGTFNATARFDDVRVTALP